MHRIIHAKSQPSQVAPPPCLVKKDLIPLSPPDGGIVC